MTQLLKGWTPFSAMCVCTTYWLENEGQSSLMGVDCRIALWKTTRLLDSSQVSVKVVNI